jgi:hypothetical protein
MIVILDASAPIPIRSAMAVNNIGKELNESDHGVWRLVRMRGMQFNSALWVVHFIQLEIFGNLR